MPLDLDKFISYHLKNKHSQGNKNLKYKPEEVVELCQMAKKLLEEGPSLARMSPPCVIVGDIHGQFNDLIRMFSMFKDKTAGADRDISGALHNKFLFLGDYVDRGRHSLECICLVLALKCKFPNKYELLRGNHEARSINRDYGFWDELNDRFGEEVAENLWEHLNQVFDCMPLSGLVGGRILCMHGGISPEIKSLEDIEKIPRPLPEPQDNFLALDLLWADPLMNLKGFKENTVRGVSVFFGEDKVQDICRDLDIDMIVRGHQMMLSGFGFFAGRKLCTVFTAPRYQSDQPNLGAVMTVAGGNAAGHIGFVMMRPPTTEDVVPGPKKSDAAKPSTNSDGSDPAPKSESGSIFHGREKEGAQKMAEAKKRKEQMKKAGKSTSKSASKSTQKKTK